MNLKSCIYIISFLISPFFQFLNAEALADDLVIDQVRYHSTFEHISVHVDILGDDNLNSSFVLEYRITGTLPFLPAAESMRAHPTMIVDGSALNRNFHAASAMFLQPNTSYDLRLLLEDPDGGNIVILKTWTTKGFPSAGENATIRYVVPGNGGGQGTLANPFRGLQEAADNASPNDVFEVGDGMYTPFVINNSGTSIEPIAFRSTNLHGAIIDGNNTSQGIVTVGSFSDSIQHLIIDGFVIRNGARGIDAQNTQYLTVQNNDFSNVDYGILNRRENGWEHDQYIYNNKMVGRTSWPQSGIPSERGVDLRGNRNVVAYNTITDFADGISTDGPPYLQSYAMDIHHNKINRIVDDLIEVDGMVSNSRVYENLCMNGRAGISVAPVFGGPAYVFRNVFVNMENSTFKMNRGPAGLYMVHNVGVKSGNALSSPVGWQNTFVKNNVFMARRYVMEEFGLVNGSTDQYDYNAFYSTRTGSSGEPWFKWDNIRYNNVTALQNGTSIETNGIETLLTHFENIAVPLVYGEEVLESEIDLRLNGNVPLVNSGVVLPNINQPYVVDGVPDRGAYELGRDLSFGHDFTSICDRTIVTTKIWNGQKNTAWFHPANWTPCGVPTKLNQVQIPGGILQYPVLNTSTQIKRLELLGDGALFIYGPTTLLKVNP